MGPPTIQPSASYISLILSYRTFTYRSNGQIRMRIPYQRSKLIILSIILSLILPTKCSIVTLLFHISVLLRDFLFGRCFLSRTSLGLLGPCCRYTKQLISATPIRLLYTQSLNWSVQCGILNMALYSLLNINFLLWAVLVIPRTICLLSQRLFNRSVSFRI